MTRSEVNMNNSEETTYAQLRLYIPRPEDGWFYVKMLSDPATMAYNAPWFPPDGCIPNPSSAWDDLQAAWIGHEPARFYAYLQRVSDGAFVGDVNFHRSPQPGKYDMGIVIFAPERSKGYGKQGLRLLLDRAFRIDGVPCLQNDFETSRDAAYRIHRAAGFRKTGVENGAVHLELTREEYLGCEKPQTPFLLLLGGPSSSGKSSVAGELTELLRAAEIPVRTVSIDDHLHMTPDEPIWEDDVFAVMPAMCRDIAAALARGETVIADHVITSERVYRAVENAAAGYPMKTVLLTCSPEILRQRETARGNRCPGSAEASLRYLYPQDGCDLTVDSGALTPAEIARLLMINFF